MAIGTVSGVNTVAVTFKASLDMDQTTDSVSKNIRDQIANAQKQLQEISSNKEMSVEQKMKRRQEIQQQISDLNNQLRQHEIELRKQHEKKMSKDEGMTSGNKETGSSKENMQKTGLTQASMKAMLSADSSIKQAKIQGDSAVSFERRTNILEEEIKLELSRVTKENGRTANVNGKYAELAEVEQKVADAATSQAKTLGEVNIETKETQEKEHKSEKKNGVNDKEIDEQDKNNINEWGIHNDITLDESNMSMEDEVADFRNTMVYRKIDMYV